MEIRAVHSFRWWNIVWATLTIGSGIAAGFVAPKINNPLVIVLGLLGILVVIGIFTRQEWGLIIMTVMIYLRLSDVGVHYYGLPSILQPFLLLLIGVVFLRWVLAHERPVGWERVILLMVLYGLVIGASLLYAVNFATSLDALLNYIKDALIAVLTVLLLQRTVTLRKVIWGLLAAGLFLGSIGVYQYLTGTFENTYWGFGISSMQSITGSTEDYRIAGPIGDPNYFALILLALFPLAFERMVNEKKWSLKIIASIAMTVCLLSILFTYSRGAFVALIVVSVVMLLRTPGRPIYFILMGVLIFILAIQFAPPQYTERMQSLLTIVPGNTERVEPDSSLLERYGELMIGAEMFLDHPLIGVGKGNYPDYYVEYAQKTGVSPSRQVFSPHNLYLEVLAEHGLLGALIFGAMLYQMLKRPLSAYADLKKAGLTEQAQLFRGVAYGIIAFLVGSFFLHGAFPRYLWLLFGIALASENIARNELARLRMGELPFDASTQ